ncbi:hypothetical protein AB4Z50_14220 [Paenibacillus sp. 2TAB26]|uniref:hypothetical protein n=1 Tax=Paenibacillus sp. 2TAB26 TaxID=3233005 RepID=UPI003F957E4B
MEKAYMCAEQVSQMQAQYDAMNLIKIAFDAGCDVVSNPIDYYVYQFGNQADVFEQCMSRIFGEVNHTFNGVNEYGSSQMSIRIPMPELREFFLIINHDEHRKYVTMFQNMMAHSDEYFCEFEMEGTVENSSLHITMTNEMGLYSPMLKQLVAIRTLVREEICKRKQMIVNGLQNVVLSKMVFDRLGITVEISLQDDVNVVFSRILELLEVNHVFGPNDAFSYVDMIDTLSTIINQGAIHNHRGEVAA